MSHAFIPSEATTITDRAPSKDRDFISPSKSSRNSNHQKRKSGYRGSRDTTRLQKEYPIIVHCHLCWDWVWQRPQQFVSRLSRRHKVLFVELVAPAQDLATPVARFRNAENCPNVTILTLQFPAWRWTDGKYVDEERRRMVQEFL